jgi:muramidase (phage lysozyme)
VAITAGLGKNQYTSTAAGAFQFLSRTWDECAKALGLTDFSPASQDLAAVFLIDRRKALDDVLAGRFDEAVR